MQRTRSFFETNFSNALIYGFAIRIVLLNKWETRVANGTI